MTGSDLIISGPEENYDIPKNGSLGKYIMDCLERRDRDEIINVDAVTGKTLTVGQLTEAVTKLVSALLSLHIKKGDVISVMSENTIEYCVPLVSGLYMGIIINLLNHNFSVEELRYSLNISKPKLIFCSKNALPVVLEVKKEFECIKLVLLIGCASGETEEGDSKVMEEFVNSLSHGINDIEQETLDVSEQGALILLSSGTTGLPKGVLLTHGNLRIPIGAIGDTRYLGVNSSDVLYTVVPFSHVFGVIVQLAAIVFASKLVILNKFQPETFLRSIEQNKVTILPLVPTLILFIAKHPMVRRFNLSSVRYVISAAAPLGKDVQEEATKVLNIESIQQAYGLTEVSSMCSLLPPGVSRPGSVGRLLPNVQLKVWDSKDQAIVGPNKPGEFCFKGPSVMKGYFGVSTTDIVFDEDGYFHSGDVGFYDDEGFLYIVDRIKDIIKYKGFQIAPSELENVLLTHNLIKDCIVFGVPDEQAGELPIAYVVREIGSSLTEDEVVKFVAVRISKHKHLHAVKFVEEVPRSAAGKLLRKDLLHTYLSS